MSGRRQVVSMCGVRDGCGPRDPTDWRGQNRSEAGQPRAQLQLPLSTGHDSWQQLPREIVGAPPSGTWGGTQGCLGRVSCCGAVSTHGGQVTCVGCGPEARPALGFTSSLAQSQATLCPILQTALASCPTGPTQPRREEGPHGGLLRSTKVFWSRSGQAGPACSVAFGL